MCVGVFFLGGGVVGLLHTHLTFPSFLTNPHSFLLISIYVCGGWGYELRCLFCCFLICLQVFSIYFEMYLGVAATVFAADLASLEISVFRSPDWLSAWLVPFIM